MMLMDLWCCAQHASSVLIFWAYYYGPSSFLSPLLYDKITQLNMLKHLLYTYTTHMQFTGAYQCYPPVALSLPPSHQHWDLKFLFKNCTRGLDFHGVSWLCFWRRTISSTVRVLRVTGQQRFKTIQTPYPAVLSKDSGKTTSCSVKALSHLFLFGNAHRQN